MNKCIERPSFPMPYAIWDHAVGCKFGTDIRLKWCTSCGASARVVMGASLNHYPTCKEHKIVSVQWGPQWNDVIACDRCSGTGMALRYIPEESFKMGVWEDGSIPPDGASFAEEKVWCPWCWGQGKYVKCNRDKPDYAPPINKPYMKSVDWAKLVHSYYPFLPKYSFNWNTSYTISS